MHILMQIQTDIFAYANKHSDASYLCVLGGACSGLQQYRNYQFRQWPSFPQASNRRISAPKGDALCEYITVSQWQLLPSSGALHKQDVLGQSCQ